MKILALDLGAASVGWAIKKGNEISEKGVVTFDTGMKKGQGGYSSPTKDRREARSKRRLIQARKYRKWELLKILLDGFVPITEEELNIWAEYKKGAIRKFPENDLFLKWLACDFSYLGIETEYANPYELRINALDTILHKHEFGRALYHLVQRRGYKNIGETDKETEKQIERRGESGFQNALDNNRTIAEALKYVFLDKGERARNQYPYREEYEKEFVAICEGQGYDMVKHQNGEYENNFVQQLWKAIIWQRPLRSQKGNIGKCTLEPSKPRCPVSHPIFEIYRTWTYINTIKYTDYGGIESFLAEKEKKILFDFFLKQDKNFKFQAIKEFLDKKFQKVEKYNYPLVIKENRQEYDSTVAGMPVCYGLIDIFGDIVKSEIRTLHQYHIGNAPKIIANYSIFDLWHILFEFDKSHLQTFAIEKLKIQNQKTKKEKEFNPFAELKSSITQGYSDLGLKAMSKIIPLLEKGYLYNDAAVLAKIPETKGEKYWLENEKNILEALSRSNFEYKWNKLISAITNILIDTYKGLEQPFAQNNFDYVLDGSDIKEVENACLSHFGEGKWENRNDKTKIISDVKVKYQAFFYDKQRKYISTPTLKDTFEANLIANNLDIPTGKLYHHSKKENLYGDVKIDKKTGLEILPEARIDSIKNPMFNKSLSILRKLVNTLIKDGTIDEQTYVVIEVARELNDNNKRVAIERYQNERNAKREKYRQFLNEFKENKKIDINVEDSLAPFELWNEQIFEETTDENVTKITNTNPKDILKESNAITRYELWTEQKGQCMYTGKMISISKLFSNEIDIEHTIPRSLLPDNTMANKTVVFSNYNRDVKGKILPSLCPNFKSNTAEGTSIFPRLEKWIEIRDGYKALHESRLKPKNGEDENSSNKRIQEKHYFKMHLDYWSDKIYRFEAEDVTDKWARRQLVDTQMITKYAREYLNTYFNKVSVQKGIITSEFRKIYGFQDADSEKNRSKHTHHAIDATVLTLIPTNSSKRISMLKKMYEFYETTKKQYTESPFNGFDSQKLIHNIENTTLIYNYENDDIIKQTNKNKRKRGKLEKLKDKNGNFILDATGNEIQLKLAGDSIRSTLFAQTFIAKIMDVERDEVTEAPKRDDKGNWKFKKEKFAFVKRVPIKDALSKTQDIVDPIIRKLVEKQKNESVIKDYQGNTIRHVRIRTKAGKGVKERVNYKSKNDYKNSYYSEAGSIPYAILISRSQNVKEMIPIASYEIAEMFKLYKKERNIGTKVLKFDIQNYLEINRIDTTDIKETKLLKVGQKVIVLENDEEYEKREKIDFQAKRLYVITKFSEGSIWLQYHLEANPDNVDKAVKNEKDKLLRIYEIQNNISEVTEDLSIKDNTARKKDFENRKYKFSSVSDFRVNRLVSVLGVEKTKSIIKELSKFKTQSAIIEVEGNTPLLKTSSKNWNFLYEGYDFKVSILGKLETKEN